MNAAGTDVVVDARRRTVLVVAGSALLTVALRMVFFGAPIGGDEAGFLLIGEQWGDGSSLYGDYWVDRPPLLIALFTLAGNLTGLRMLGCVAAAVVVVAVAVAAHRAAGDRAARWAAAAAALFCAAPWLGTVRVNGEILAAPFVAVALTLTVHALVRPPRRAVQLALAAGAGAAAACAALVKQNTLDGFVFAAAALVVIAVTRPGRRAEAGRVLAAGAAGALATLAVVLAAAASLGTEPLDMFDATVTFRFEAGETIRTSASDATTDRLVLMILAWLASGLAVISALALVQAVRRRRDPVQAAVVVTLGFCSVMAMAGGSYWLHYLQQLVPAAALAAGLLAAAVRRPVRLGLAAAVAVATLGDVAINVGAGIDEGIRAETIGGEIGDAAAPGDTIVVAYGQPNVLWNAGLPSPYPYLWSLPIRTLDADLTDLTAVLAGPERPTWFVNWSGLDSWGIDATTLRPELERHYREVAEVCGKRIWVDRSVDRPALAESEEC